LRNSQNPITRFRNPEPGGGRKKTPNGRGGKKKRRKRRRRRKSPGWVVGKTTFG